MNLDILISAANWLYENSPAKCVTKEYISAHRHISMLVYGDGELEDRLFELLFTTAFLPNASIDLVRVCSRAADREADFVVPNEDWLKYFARTPMNTEDQRPLAIQFYDSESDEWRNLDKFGFAYAIVPENVELNVQDCLITTLEGIPVYKKDGESWSPEDEKVVPVLRVARRVHTAYTMGWNDRYREEDIDKDLYGPNDYMLRSSLRLAVSIPWKLAIADVKNSGQLLVKLRSRKNDLQGHPLKDYIAWQEHRSWQAFMLLDGWKMPTDAQMDEYMFRDGNDHRDKANKLHPCLCDLEQDDWFKGEIELKNCPPGEWSRLHNERIGEFTLLDQVSLKIHHRCKEIVVSEDYGRQMDALFDDLEKTLIECHPLNMGLHFDRLWLMERMFSRLQSNEKNSYAPFEQACHAFMEGVKSNCGEDESGRRIQNAFEAMQGKAKIAVERNRYCDYKSIDAKIIDWIPWIIDDASVDTVWKLYANNSYFENITSVIMLRPRRLIFICENGKLSNRMMNAYKQVLERHGLASLIVDNISVDDLEDGTLDFGSTETAQNWIDFIGADLELSSRIIIPDGARLINFVDGEMRDTSKHVPLPIPFCQKIRFTIDEAIQIKGHNVITLGEENEMLGMEEDYETLWKLCTAIKQGGEANPWKALIDMLKESDNAIRFSIYRKKEGRYSTEVEFTADELNQNYYKILAANGGLRALYDLQRRRAIEDLVLQVADGMAENWIKATVFPKEIRDEATHRIEYDYSESRKTLEQIILHSTERNRFSVDMNYAKNNEPVFVYDVGQPIHAVPADPTLSNALNRLANKGLLRRVGDRTKGNFVYKSGSVRHGLKEEGFALEAYVYYTLFLSGRFDDVRSNVRIVTKAGRDIDSETELDVLVIKNGVMGVISCKDRDKVNKRDPGTGAVREHVPELVEQAREYGIRAKPILVCGHYRRHTRPNQRDLYELNQSIVRQCEDNGVLLIGYDLLDPRDPDSRERLVDRIERYLS